jgi:UPF0148 protein
MSEDEFDREAEREKLREKYEDDQADRQATERMSELLLRGATMTDQHCETCGDPIFRHEGQAFCPTCQTEVAEQGADPDQATTGGTGADPDPEAADSGGGDPAEAARDHDAPNDVAAGQSPDQSAGAPASAGRTDRSPRAGGGEAPEEADSQPNPQRLARDADDPRAALADAVTTLARDAATTDDPRRARDLLAAAREAAEALATIDG